MTTDTTPEAIPVPLRQRPIPDQLDYFSEKLAAQINPGDVPREAIIAMGATIVGIGAIATELRKQATATSHEQPPDERDGAMPKTCAHCQRDLAGASIHTIQGIDVCADIRHCLTRQAEQREALRTEYGIRATYTSTLSSEGPVAETLDDALEALAQFDAKHGHRVVSRELVQRQVGDWQKVGEHA